MLTIGLTGGIGSGKTTVANCFAELGIELVDADLAAREVVKPGSPALADIAAHFGEEILLADGSLDRAALRTIVFADEEQRLWLEALLHPLINALLRQQLAACQSDYCLLVSPLLLETSQKELVDRIVVIDVSEETQLVRTMARDGSDEQTIRGIIAAQIDRQSRLQAADDIIDNEQPVSALKQQVQALHEHYLQLARRP
ncbi:MAG: dephospho-CoA kinase [Pseudomonadales bacterium]|nr:dephospho-CoA kinase [Pseudomonadales bacterium]